MTEQITRAPYHGDGTKVVVTRPTGDPRTYVLGLGRMGPFTLTDDGKLQMNADQRKAGWSVIAVTAPDTQEPKGYDAQTEVTRRAVHGQTETVVGEEVDDETAERLVDAVERARARGDA